MKYKVVLPILGFEDIEEFELEEIEPNFYKLKSGDVSFTLSLIHISEPTRPY
jgi:flagellar assembly factor FliW